MCIALKIHCSNKAYLFIDIQNNTPSSHKLKVPNYSNTNLQDRRNNFYVEGQRALETSVIECEKSECECPTWTLPPEHPPLLSFPCVPENIDEIKVWLVERFSASTFIYLELLGKNGIVLNSNNFQLSQRNWFCWISHHRNWSPTALEVLEGHTRFPYTYSNNRCKIMVWLGSPCVTL